MNPHPPAWAQWLLSSLLPAHARDSVLGDLLEEYRDAQLPERGGLRADCWYVQQAAGFIWRSSRLWAMALGMLLGGRAILDVSVPTGDHFHTRAMVTTYVAMALFVALGTCPSSRSRC